MSGYEEVFPELGAKQGKKQGKAKAKGKGGHKSEGPGAQDADATEQLAIPESAQHEGLGTTTQSKDAPEEKVEEEKENEEAESFCMMSTPAQLEEMREKLAQTLLELDHRKASLQHECDDLRNEQEKRNLELADNAARKQDFFVADLDDDEREENEQFERELDKRRDDFLTKAQEFQDERSDLERRQKEFEEKIEVKALRAEIKEDKEESARLARQVKEDFDKTVSEMERQHQLNLKEVRAELTESNKGVSDKILRDALKDQAKEYERTSEAAKKLHNEIESKVKRDEGDGKNVKALEQQLEQMRLQLDKDTAARKKLQEKSQAFADEKLKLWQDVEGLKRKLEDVRTSEWTRREQETEDLVEQCEERLALSQSVAEAHGSTSRSSGAGSSNAPASGKPLSRHEEVLQEQQRILEEYSRNAASSNPGGAGSDGGGSDQDEETLDEVQKAISEAARREQRDMEEWIAGQCLEMGIEDPDELDPEMREEMQRAYCAR